MRILVMRLWPRGVRKESVNVWFREVGTEVELIKDWKVGRVSRTEYAKRYYRMMKGEEQKRLVQEVLITLRVIFTTHSLICMIWLEVM
jgi:uncharacterized protein YeaO (DUF488 family)